MGCCSPNYHNQVEEKEREVNQAEREKLPLWGKVTSAFIVISAIGFYIY